jgi:hypothetical protein
MRFKCTECDYVDHRSGMIWHSEQTGHRRPNLFVGDRMQPQDAKPEGNRGP